MPITEDRLSRLREFGLSEYAARAYLALLDLGVAEARDISTLSKVPTSKIYHVLDQLHERGLVEILPEFPKRFAPVPFSAFLEKVLVDHRARVTALERERDGLVRMFSLAGNVDLGERGSFMLLRGRRNVLSELRGLLAGAESDVVIYGGAGALQRAILLHPEASAAATRGASLRLLVPAEAERDPSEPGPDPFEVRHRAGAPGDEAVGVTIAVADGRRAMIAHFIPDDRHPARGDDTAIVTDDRGMITALRSVLDDMWRLGASAAAPPPPGALVDAFWAGLRGHAVLAVPSAALPLWFAGDGPRVALARGARVRLLTDAAGDLGAPSTALPGGLPGVEVRAVPGLHLHGAVADAASGILVLPTAPQPGAPGGADRWVPLREAAQLAPFAAAFETLWAVAARPGPVAERSPPPPIF